jgi:hypothetical protein
VLTPPHLDYKWQEYLYHNIRPFVRDEFKDKPSLNKYCQKFSIF